MSASEVRTGIQSTHHAWRPSHSHRPTNHADATQPSVPHRRILPKSRAGSSSCAKARAFPMVMTGTMISQKARQVQKTVPGSSRSAKSHNSAPAATAPNVMQRSAGNQRSATCPAASGAARYDIAAVALASAISSALKCSSARRTLNIGTQQPMTANIKNMKSESRAFKIPSLTLRVGLGRRLPSPRPARIKGRDPAALPRLPDQDARTVRRL